LASSGSDKTLRLWNPASLVKDKAPVGHSDSVWFAVFSPDGHTLASAGKDKTIRLWDTALGREKIVLRGHGREVRALAFSPDGKALASGSWDNTVRLWNPITGNEKRVLKGHKNGVSWVTFSPDGKVLASGSRDKTIRLWDPTTGNEERTLRGHSNAVACLSFNSDGKVLASGSLDTSIRLWNPASGEQRGILAGHSALVSGLAFTPDGESLVSGSWDRTIRLWDLKSGRGRILGRHQGRVYRLSISSDGRRVGAPGSNKVARIWDVRSGKNGVLRGHQAEINSLRFSPNDQLAVTASDDGTVRVWDVDKGKPFWRTTALLSTWRRIHTHRGWEMLALEGNTPKGDKDRQEAFTRAKWRSAIEKDAHVASESGQGNKLCLETHHQQLEMWDMQADQLLFKEPALGLDQVLALSSGCLVLARGKVRLYGRAGAYRELAPQATAISLGHDEILVVMDQKVLAFDSWGRKKTGYKTGLGVRAVLRSKDRLALGFEDGNIEVVSLSHKERKQYFKDVASSPVMQMLEGPRGTLIVGYANGQLGIWNFKTGLRLYLSRLHGPVRHLQIRKGTLYAASELGDKLVFDLSAFQKKYCDLVRDVWQKVPVVWESGSPTLRSAPDNHQCSKP